MSHTPAILRACSILPFLALPALLPLPAFAQTAPPTPAGTTALQIAHFQDDKTAALSLTFDDGSENQIAKGIPLLQKYHLPASFFVIAGLTREHDSDPLPHNKDQWGEVSWDQWRQAAKEGFEIGNHSLTHTFLTKLSDEELAHEVNDSAALIAREIGTAPISFVCPFNEMNDHVRAVVFQHHLVLRDQWLEFGGPGFTSDTAAHAVDDAILQHKWLVPMLHGVDHDGYNPLNPDTLEQILAYIDKRRSDFWLDTFGRIGCYQQEREHSTLTTLQQTAQSVTFHLETTLDPARYNVPLTIVVPRWWSKPSQLTLHSPSKTTVVIKRELPDRLLLTIPHATATYTLEVDAPSMAKQQPSKSSSSSAGSPASPLQPTAPTP